jgi:very-long-chain enoyl-CoA reductase
VHFLKRELETLFLHRFSLATMPARNIFKNSLHYWVFAGLNLALWVYAPSSPAASTSDSPISAALTAASVALFIFGEMANLSTHVTLRNLRPEGSTARGIPQGFGFGLVTCPNYFFEILAWIGVWGVCRSWAAALFIAIAGGQMALWAKKKERRYRKEFREQYTEKRWVLIPGLF